MASDEEIALQVFRQRAYETLMESILFRVIASVSHLVAPDERPEVARRLMFQAILRGVEADAAFADKIYLSDPSMASGVSDAMRALYADEFREVAERVKTSINKYLSQIEN